MRVRSLPRVTVLECVVEHIIEDAGRHSGFLRKFCFAQFGPAGTRGASVLELSLFRNLKQKLHRDIEIDSNDFVLK